ncbi:MAG: outer membrane protein assembly factor BamD [Chitinivibrionales bacterium]|nr:outer membrane protein assembly factor BamD [Chitinivibrionales bacterium]
MHKNGIFALSAAVLALTNCTHLTMLRTEELRAVRNHVDSLNTQLTSLQKEIHAKQNENNELLRLIRADQQVKFNELDRRISVLESNLSESQQRLDQIGKQTWDIKSHWAEKAREDSMQQSMVKSEIARLFQVAYDDFMARRYDLAISGFSDIRKQYPQSSESEEAQYWIAESNYARKKYATAEQLYKEYIKEYPSGAKICVALYKLGKTYEREKKVKARNMVWNKLQQRCPEAEETLAAQEQMK